MLIVLYTGLWIVESLNLYSCMGMRSASCGLEHGRDTYLRGVGS